MTEPTNGAVSEDTSRMAMIFGMKVSVTSCTCVSACSRAMTMPIAMAAPTAGPEATITVQMADWTMSRASAWFMSAYRDACVECYLLAAIENRHRASRDDADASNGARRRAVGGGDRAANQALRLRQGERRQHAVELGVGLDRLLDAREGRELSHELAGIGGLGGVLVLHLRDEQ